MQTLLGQCKTQCQTKTKKKTQKKALNWEQPDRGANLLSQCIALLNVKERLVFGFKLGFQCIWQLSFATLFRALFSCSFLAKLGKMAPSKEKRGVSYFGGKITVSCTKSKLF